jgi:acyl-CoA oxidase
LHLKYADFLAGFTIDDTLSLTPKFWAMHRDGIILNDLGAHAMLSIQHNLVAGTLARYATGNAALEKILQDVVDFKVS